MVTVACPGDIPGPVPVTLDLPDGYEAQPAPGVAFVASGPDPVGGVHPSIVVSIRRVAEGLTLEDIAELVGTELAGDERIVVGEAQRDGDRVVRTLTFGGDTAFSQTQVMWMAHVSEFTADVVTLTFTHSADGSGSDERDAVVASVVIGEPARS